MSKDRKEIKLVTKVAFFGGSDRLASGVGKTTLIQRKTTGFWEERGGEPEHFVDPQADTHMLDSLKGNQVIFLMYDVTDESSFQNIEKWHEEIKKHGITGKKILLGNKCDSINDHRVVTKARGQALANHLGIPFFEISAKTGLNVDEAFRAAGIYPPKEEPQPAPLKPVEKPWYERWFGFGGDNVPADKPVSSAPSQQSINNSSVSSSSYNALPPKQSRVQKPVNVKKESDSDKVVQLPAEKKKSEQQKAKPVGFQAEAKKVRENKLQYEEHTEEERIIEIKSVIGLFQDSQVEGGLDIGKIEVPSGVKCSLSLKIMNDPVLVENTKYICERAVIEEHFKAHPKEAQKLIPATRLKEVIEEWKKWAGLGADQQPGLDLS